MCRALTPIAYIATSLSLLLFSSFSCPSQEASIKGHLRSKSHKNVAGITVFAKGIVENGMGKAVTDKNGNFTLDFDLGSEMIPSVYYVNHRNDTILLKQDIHMDSESIEMTFWIK